MLKSRLLSSVKILPICALAAILSACGGGSGGGSSVPPPPPPPPPPPAADTVAPTVSFSPDSLTVESGATGSSTLTATDNVGVTSGPTVTCTNGGSFSDSTFTAPTVTATTTSVCTATASDAAGNSGTGTLTVTIPQPERAPEASAKSNFSLVTEGQPFVLDARDSTDADGDALTYSWQQTGGTTIAFSDNTTAVQNLTAPLLTADESVTFEVTVSDGTNTSTAQVSIMIDHIQAFSADAAATPFFPSGPPLTLKAITPDSDNGYILHWTSQGNSTEQPVSSQNFTFEDVRNGEQVNGELTIASPNNGRVFQIEQSGNDIAYIGSSTQGITLNRGRLDSSVSFGDVFYVDQQPTQFASQHAAPIGDTQLLFVANITPTSDEYAINALVVQADGTALVTEISSPSAKNKSNLFVLPYTDNEFAVLWWETNADSTGTDIYMQRATTGGILIGNKTLISSELSNLNPGGVRLSNGNFLITWDNVSGVFRSKGKILSPTGSVVVDEFEINVPENIGGKTTHSIATDEGGFVVVTNGRVSGGGREIAADIFDMDGNRIGNEVLLAEDLDGFTGLVRSSVVSPDGKIIIGWNTRFANEGADRPQIVSFYPIGVE